MGPVRVPTADQLVEFSQEIAGLRGQLQGVYDRFAVPRRVQGEITEALGALEAVRIALEPEIGRALVIERTET
jgi:hypothetical protein